VLIHYSTQFGGNAPCAHFLGGEAQTPILGKHRSAMAPFNKAFGKILNCTKFANLLIFSGQLKLLPRDLIF